MMELIRNSYCQNSKHNFMENFNIKTQYRGITNSQRFADINLLSEHSEITGFQNVKLILEKTSLNEEAAKDLSYVVSHCEEERIKEWIEFKTQEIFTVASFLFDAKTSLIKKKKRKELEKQIEDYFQWCNIRTNPKFPFEINEDSVDWDLPPVNVLRQLYPSKYYQYLEGYGTQL